MQVHLPLFKTLVYPSYKVEGCASLAYRHAVFAIAYKSTDVFAVAHQYLAELEGVFIYLQFV